MWEPVRPPSILVRSAVGQWAQLGECAVSVWRVALISGRGKLGALGGKRVDVRCGCGGWGPKRILHKEDGGTWSQIGTRPPDCLPNADIRGGKGGRGLSPSLPLEDGTLQTRAISYKFCFASLLLCQGTKAEVG